MSTIKSTILDHAAIKLQKAVRGITGFNVRVGRSDNDSRLFLLGRKHEVVVVIEVTDECFAISLGDGMPPLSFSYDTVPFSDPNSLTILDNRIKEIGLGVRVSLHILS